MSIKRALILPSRAPVTLKAARMMSTAGCEVFVCDSMKKTITEKSRYVSKHFVIPRFDDPSMKGELQRIIEEENIDFVLPMGEETLHLAKAKIPHLFTSEFSLLHSLHNKWTFYEFLCELNIRTPKTILLESKGKSIIKPVYSRFASRCSEVENLYVQQEWVEGKRLCSYSVCREGKVFAHVSYEVIDAIGIGASISSRSIRDEEIEKTVEKIVSKTNFTGQISFDFIRSAKGLYTIECNPRATTGIFFFEENLLPAFLGEKIIFPKEGQFLGEHFLMLHFAFKEKKWCQPDFWKRFFRVKNPLFSKKDIRPFLSALPILLSTMKQAKREKLSFQEYVTQGLEVNG